MNDDYSIADELGIKPGSKIDTKNESYIILDLLGEGGFGAVFKVQPESDWTKEYAMKVEKKKESRRHSKLKMEIAILKLVNSLRVRSHFLKLIDRGKKPSYFFIVMELAGKSLEDLKSERPNKIFSIATSLGTSIQCLEAAEDLHSQGFIHRDLKPENYAVGLSKKSHVIYMLDFGIARKILKENDELKTPREMVSFKGTVRYASLSCHMNREMGYKDDCESWFYVLIELMVHNGLPWRKLSDRNVVCSAKMKSREVGSKEFNKFYEGLSKCQEELVMILKYIDSLSYAETPDYEYIYKLIREAANSANVNIDDPFDWEGSEFDSSTKKRREHTKKIVITPPRR